MKSAKTTDRLVWMQSLNEKVHEDALQLLRQTFQQFNDEVQKFVLKFPAVSMVCVVA